MRFLDKASHAFRMRHYLTFGFEIASSSRRAGQLLLALAVLASAGSTLASSPMMPALIPTPAQMNLQDGTFPLHPQTAICADSNSQQTAQYLAKRLRTATGFPFELCDIVNPESATNVIVLTTQPPKSGLGSEGYELTVRPHAAIIRAADTAGLFYGVQSLLQLLPPQIFASNVVAGTDWQMPCVRIEDQPRFKWRGFMLDVSRHFFTVDQVKEFLDAMALHKLNTFHWHLVDMDGWRIEIKKYPRLTEIGAWRNHIGFDLDPQSSTTYGPDGRYGGFYTQDEIRDVVAYAQARHITVVPEIEMPGHSTEVLAAYPELGCSGKAYEIDRGPNYHMGVFCAGKDKVYTFLENVLDEVFDLFPSKYIHIGGDEVPKGDWKQCATCQARMKEEGLQNEEQLQSYFIQRMEKYINTHGRVVVGWSEILQGGLAPNAVVMDWIGGGAEAASSGHDVVMSPTAFCYLDYYQSLDQSLEPRAIWGYVPLWKVYSFEPVPAKLDTKYRHHILGAQGNLWTEYIAAMNHAEYMTFPRLCALSEVLWSPKSMRDWHGFQQRLDVHLKRLDALGLNYRPDKSVRIGQWAPADLGNEPSTQEWKITPEVKGSGVCHVMFDYRDGSSGLDIDWVALMEDGREVARETHPGLAGPQPRKAAYVLRLPKYQKNARYTVRAHIAGAEGSKSFGNVLLAFVPMGESAAQQDGADSEMN